MNINKYGGGDSPFDKIREVDEHGQEFWSARRLMELMGYSRWENYLEAIERAKATAENVGMVLQEVFRDVTKNSGRAGGRPQQDIRMTRAACYLVALNGDPRKTESAASQAYFAARTREAELSETARALPKDYKSALRDLLDEVERAERLQEKVKALEPKAKFYDSVSVAINAQTVAEVAKLFGWGEIRFFRWLRESKYLMSLGTDRNLPYQKWIESDLFTLVKKSYKHSKSGEDVVYTRTLITGKGICYFHKKLTDEGIILPALEFDSNEAAA